MCAQKKRNRFYAHPKNARNKNNKPAESNYATIDLGTNNCRFLVATPTPHSFRVVESFSRITRLGEALVETEVLSEAAMERTIEALKICASKIANYKPVNARYVATEACRRAKNGAEFISKVEQNLGINLEIINPQEEARLAVAGCVPLVNRNINHALVFDIGGGSTEISWARIANDGTASLEGMISIPFGVVTISESFSGKDLSDKAYDEIKEKTSSYLEDFSNKHNIISCIESHDVQMIGTSGTITTLGALHLGLPKYNRSAVDGMCLSFEEIRKIQNRIKKMPVAKRMKHPCIGPSRADLTLAGSAIVEALCDFWPIGEITVADRGLREGMLLEMMAKDRKKTA